jgi:hypothetical protein
MNHKAERVRKLLGEIITECGGDRSESATESFLVALDSAVKTAKKETRASHRQGLCLDCTTVIAYELVPDKPVVTGRPQVTRRTMSFSPNA